MSRHSFTKRSLYRVLPCVVVACSCFNVYIFCMYHTTETFTRAVYSHVQLRSNLSNQVQDKRISAPKKTVEVKSRSKVTVNVHLSRDPVRWIGGRRNHASCVDASNTEKRKHLSTLRTIVNPHDLNVTLYAEKVCKRDAPFILVTILSISSHFEMRKTIRETWASPEQFDGNHRTGSKSVEVLFVVGRANSSRDQTLLSKESDEHGDILQGDFREEYSLITRKVLMGMKWMLENCRNATFLLKVDEDVFVNIQQLIKELSVIQLKPLIIGYRHATGSVFRTGNWRVSFEQFQFCHYFPYVEGNSYVITQDLVAPLFNVSQYHPYMATEDAYITGILREMIGANIYSQRRFATPTKHLKDRVNRSDLEKFYKRKIISETRCSIDDMKRLWSTYTDIRPFINRIYE